VPLIAIGEAFGSKGDWSALDERFPRRRRTIGGEPSIGFLVVAGAMLDSVGALRLGIIRYERQFASSEFGMVVYGTG
jgi:hypothetical protein